MYINQYLTCLIKSTKKRSTCSISVKTSHPALVLFRLVHKRWVAKFGYGSKEVLGSNITVIIRLYLVIVVSQNDWITTERYHKND